MKPHDREEELLDLLLNRGEESEAARTAALLAARSDPETARVLREYDDLLGRARTTDRRAEWRPAREKALIKSILAATTRQDLRWRGDVRLVVEFVGRRLRSSPALRALAATVLGLTFVTTVFTMLAVREAKQEPLRFRIAPAGDGDLADLVEDSDAIGDGDGLILPEVGELTDAERRSWDIENALRRDRFLLAAWEAPASLPAAAEDDVFAVRLLAARASFLATGDRPAWLFAEETLAAVTGLERALHAEVLLDVFARTGERSPLLPRTLQRITRSLADAAEDDAVAMLGRRALRRATALGLWDQEGEGKIEFAPRPLDDEWRSLLGRALPAPLAARPAARVWLD